MMTYPHQEQSGVAAARGAMQIRPGVGTRVHLNGLGYAISSGPVSGGTFQGFFRPQLFGGGLLLSPGVIDQLQPKIGKAFMSETVLKLNPSEQNERGESWACLEVEPTPAGLLNDQTRIEVIHTGKPKDETPARGRKALAMILWAGNRPVRAEHIVWWNLSYLRVTEGGQFVRHLFL